MRKLRISAVYHGKTVAECSVFPQEGTVISIGRDEKNTLVIPNAYIGREHCMLTLQNGHWYVRNLSKNGSFVNGLPVTGYQPLHRADKLTLLPGEKAISILVSVVEENERPGRRTLTVTGGTGGAGGRDLEFFVIDGLDRTRQFRTDANLKSRILFGRAADNDIVLDSQVISTHHGVIELENGCWFVSDAGSKNGLWVNGVYYRRLRKYMLSSGDVIKVDAGEANQSRSAMIIVHEKGGHWHRQHLEPGRDLLVGRAEGCDIHLDHVSVSRKHAVIRYDDRLRDFVIQNLGTNGILVNGAIVRGRCRLENRSSFQIANTSIYRCGDVLYYNLNRDLKSAGPCLSACGLMRDVKNGGQRKRILNDVNLKIAPGEFVAIVGGSGCGKSTLLNALTGYEKASGGVVMVGDKSLYQNYDYFKSLIGFVPQQDIVYDHIELKKMLAYTAKLRMPRDSTPAEQEARVREVLEMVELSDFSGSMVKKLSGGQRKRASIAVELLADPGLFFLDEPTSGLDPGTERNLMVTLRKLASEKGKTVIMVTHTTLNLHLCDKIVFMGKGGRLCFFGAPDEALRFFGVDNLVDVYNMVAENTDRWQEKYESMTHDNEYSQETSVDVGKIAKSPFFKQAFVLAGRYFTLICNDRARLALMMLEPVIMGLILYVCKPAEVYETYLDTKNLLFTFVCCAIWIGIFNSVQEICKERAILKREYMANLRLTAYITSKFLVQSLLCLIQSLLLFAVFALLIGLPEEGMLAELPLPEMLLTTFLTILSSTCMGLCLSSVVNNSDRAMTLSPFLLVVQLVFAGIIFELEGAVELISNVTVSRWAISALGVSTDLERLFDETPSMMQQGADIVEEMFEHTAANLGLCWGIMLGFCVLFCVAAVLLLTNISKDSR